LSTTHPTNTPAAPRKARRLAAPAMLEKDWQRVVMEMAQLAGWKRAHFRPAIRQSGTFSTPVAGDGKGFPDLVLVHRFAREKIFAELKTDKGRTTPEQDDWLEILGGVVWRPRDIDAVRARLFRHAERTTV